MSKVAKVKQLIRYEGISAPFKLAIGRLLDRLIDFRCVYVILTPPAPPDKGNSLPDERFQFAELDAIAVRRMMQDPENRFYKDLVQAALEKQDRFMAIIDTKEDVMANFCWYSVQPTFALDGYFHFDPRFFYAYHAYVKPQYRGRRFANIIGNYVMKMMVNEGLSGQIGMVEWTNFRSLASSRRRDAEIIGKICRFRLGKKRFTRIQRYRKDIAFDISDSPSEQIFSSDIE